MNQILSVDMPKNKEKRSSNSNKASTKSVIIVFCILLIVFAILIVVVGVHLFINNSEEVENTVISGVQPNINIENVSQTTLNIIISHDKEISQVSYGWNDEITEELTDIGKSNLEIQVEIPSGTNTLKVNVTDSIGVTQSFSGEYTGVEETEITNGPDVVLEKDGNKVKVTVTSDITISTISYNWDNGDENQIQINDTSAEQYIDVEDGEHTLYILAVDVEGNETAKEQTMVGDTEPILTVVTDKVNFIIKASDDEGLTKMTINLNGEDLDEVTINNIEYEGTVPLEDGENKIIVTVYNINGLSSVQRIRYVKE